MCSKSFKGLVCFVVVLITVYGVLVLFAHPAANHPFGGQGQRHPLVIAHQGGAGLWPGNTMHAFEHSAALGVDVLEMDLHSTSDGVLVLILVC